MDHGLTEPHFPVSSKTEDSGSTVISAFSAIRITNHGSEDPIDGDSPGAKRHSHGDERRENMDQ